MEINFKPFDAKTVPLKGINLIEASAGTGKTYSIALLALRLILENEIEIEKILMVTFTKAAVAELEERIRLFVRLAYKEANGETIGDDNIVELVKNANKPTERKIELLKKAILFLDETSIVTIHSFCQITLTEFAFETQQLFGAELLQSTSSILQEEVDQFWRENVTNIPTEMLNLLLNNGLSRNSIAETVKHHLDGKGFYKYDENEDYIFNETVWDLNINELKSIDNEAIDLWANILEFIKENIEELKTKSQNNTYAKKTILANFENIDKCANLINSNSSGYIFDLYADIKLKLNDYNSILLKKQEFIIEIINKITCQAINIIGKGIRDYMHRNNQMSFDDLISKLNEAILKPDNFKLVDGLRKKYKAVFIDEFQDTDKKQYQIFDKAFGAETIVFYIGDPKQSIYAFRTADIFTYFEAQKAADNCYGMNQNFRSSNSYIDAMNEFFNPSNLTEKFDPFHFENSEQSIKYIKVNAPESNKKLEFLKDGLPDMPISITSIKNKPEIALAVAAQIAELLKSDSTFSIQKTPIILNEPVILNVVKNPEIKNSSQTRKIKPSDIGVLVRTKTEGKDIQNQLSKLNISSVLDKDEKVLQSSEAKYILYILEAMVDINRNNINRALLSPFTGFNQSDIVKLDLQYNTELFKDYQTLLLNDGIFTSLKAFTSHYKTNSKSDSQKMLSNLYQIAELLHKTETNKKLNAVDLIHWLKRGIEGVDNEGDEYQQRIESDDEAVKIVTIHSSKGLEYNIVFAPFLDFTPASLHKHKATRLCDFRDPETGRYKSFTNYAAMDDAEKAIHDQQEKQEFSRLIYVTITRAIYKCYIYKSKSSNSPLVYFVNALANADENLIEQTSEFPKIEKLASPQKDSTKKTIKPVNFELKENYWRKMSYSYLKAPYQYFPKIKSNIKLIDYDNFIFSEMARGAKAGNLLHYIFENIQLNNENSWEKVIHTALTLYSIKDTLTYKNMLPKMLHHILNAQINLDGSTFKLSSVETKKCINEFEFDFSVSSFKVPQLKNLADENVEINLGEVYDLEGVMNGKIDLFFEHEGKYFVLDWKSNYLGDSLENYSQNALSQAMNESNYHLQYFIYCLASKKYLESRLPNFNYETDFGGVIYLFIRGIRENSDTGIFVSKPSLQKMEMLADILSGKVYT